MTLFELLDGSDVIQRLVLWDGASQPSQFGTLVPAQIDPALGAVEGDTFSGGILIRGVPLVQQHRQTIVANAQLALASNDTFLALATPTQTQTLTQVQRLTRQCNGIVRVLLDQFDTATDT